MEQVIILLIGLAVGSGIGWHLARYTPPDPRAPRPRKFIEKATGFEFTQKAIGFDEAADCWVHILFGFYRGPDAHLRASPLAVTADILEEQFDQFVLDEKGEWALVPKREKN